MDARDLEGARAPLVTDDSGLLELRGIVKSWGPRQVLDGIDLVLRPGRLVRIKGANGSGKTTLLRIAGGLIRPDGGDVSLCGLDAERDRSHYLARLGFLSAGDRGVYARLSARGHLELAGCLALLPAEERTTAVEQAIEDFDLAAFADRRAERTSTGQRQRTRLAMAFVHSPDVVLLDEPANSLDDDGIAALTRGLERLKARGGAALSMAPSAIDAPIPFDERFVLSSGALHAE